MPNNTSSIKYTYFNNNNENLILILPQSMQLIEESGDLIESLKNMGNIIFIQSGYHGISKVDNQTPEAENSLENFQAKLLELLSTYKYKNLIVIGGSAGSVQALNLLKRNDLNLTKVFLVSPAIYKPKKFLNTLFLHAIYYFSNPNQAKLLDRLFGNKFVEKKLTWASNIYKHTLENIGPRSYLLALRDAINFRLSNQVDIETLVKKCVTIIGSEDFMYAHVCDGKLCKTTKHYVLNCGHSILKYCGKEVAQIVKVELTKSG